MPVLTESVLIDGKDTRRQAISHPSKTRPPQSLSLGYVGLVIPQSLNISINNTMNTLTLSVHLRGSGHCGDVLNVQVLTELGHVVP